MIAGPSTDSATAETGAAANAIAFNSLDELLEYSKAKAKANGIALTRTSNNEKFYLRCSRWGSVREKQETTVDSEDQKKRNRGSLRCGCKFQQYVAQDKRGLKGPKNKWYLHQSSNEHNHGNSATVAFAAYRQFNDEHKDYLRQHARTTVKELVLSFRRTFPNQPVIDKDIRNFRTLEQMEAAKGRSAIECLLDGLNQPESKYTVSYQTSDDGALTHLFFAHEKSIAKLQQYPDVLILDCTYKTNKWQMPLFNILGVDGTGKSFTVGYAFLRGETAEDYTWALNNIAGLLAGSRGIKTAFVDCAPALMNALESIFPGISVLLCIFHIVENVGAQLVRKYPDVTDESKQSIITLWNSVVYAATLEDYAAAVQALWDELDDDFPMIRMYLEDTWLVHHKRFVKFWTSQVLTLGIRATSRVEGSHRCLKDWLHNGVGDFMTIFAAMDTFIDKQLTDIQNAFDVEKDRLSTKMREILNETHQIREHVSRVTFNDHLYDSIIQARTEGPLQQCNHQYAVTMGLPCADQIRYEYNLTIPLSAIHPAWRYYPSDTNIDPYCPFDATMDPYERLEIELAAVRKRFDTLQTASQRQRALQQLTQVGIISGSVLVPVRNKRADTMAQHHASKRQRTDTSTRADPTLSAHVAREQQERAATAKAATRAKPKCSACGSIDHNAKRCEVARVREAARIRAACGLPAVTPTGSGAAGNVDDFVDVNGMSDLSAGGLDDSINEYSWTWR